MFDFEDCFYVRCYACGCNACFFCMEHYLVSTDEDFGSHAHTTRCAIEHGADDMNGHPDPELHKTRARARFAERGIVRFLRGLPAPVREAVLYAKHDDYAGLGLSAAALLAGGAA